MELPFEVGPRAAPSDALVARTVAQFGLGDPITYQDLGGAYNLNLSVQTSTGTYIVRVYRPWVSMERLHFLHRLKRGLNGTGLPLPKPIGVVSGVELGLDANRPIEVEAFTPHDGVADTWPRYRTAFAMLGRLHAALAERVDVARFVPPQVENYGLPATLLAWLERTQGQIAQSTQISGRDEALALCEETRSLLAQIEVWWQEAGRHLPRQIIHGDYGGENVLFRQERIVALLDFDLTAIHERAFELAYTAYWMLDRLDGNRSFDQRAWHRIGEMLSRYDATVHHPLAAQELQSIPIEMARVPLYWIAEAGWTPDPIRAILGHAEDVRLSRWIMEHREELVLIL